MMKKVLSTLFAVALITLSFSACSSNASKTNENTPEGVFEKFMTSWQASDGEAIVACYDLDLDKDEKEKLVSHMEEGCELMKVTNYKVISKEMAEDKKSATLSVEMTFKHEGGETTEAEDIVFTLNEDGEWLMCM